MKVTRTFQRKIGKRAIRHAVVEHPIHAEDVEMAAERRQMYFVAVELPQTDGHRILPQLGGGMYFVRDRSTHKLVPKDGEHFIEEMDSYLADKSWYYRIINDKKCKAGWRWKKTKGGGIQGCVVTAAPWWSAALYNAAQNGEEAKVKELSVELAHTCANVFAEQTNRMVLSVQVHYDTANLHLHIFSTRVGDDNKFIKGTNKRLGILGPWATGNIRLGEGGFIPLDSANYKRAKFLMDREQAAFGEPPLDIALARAFDLGCWAMFGTSPNLAKAMQIYRKGLTTGVLTRLLGVQSAVEKQVEIWSRFVQNGGNFNGGVTMGQILSTVRMS
jgi:hypothetical protein